jgi:hypothetical protein
LECLANEEMCLERRGADRFGVDCPNRFPLTCVGKSWEGATVEQPGRGRCRAAAVKTRSPPQAGSSHGSATAGPHRMARTRSRCLPRAWLVVPRRVCSMVLVRGRSAEVPPALAPAAWDSRGWPFFWIQPIDSAVVYTRAVTLLPSHIWTKRGPLRERCSR